MKYKCPYCGEILNEEEAESVADCGCPSCGRYFDVDDYIIDYKIDADYRDIIKKHNDLVNDNGE